MHPFVAVFSILGALALGAISPGPSFLFVTRTAVAVSRRASLAAAAGMGLGAALICLLALLGVRAVLAQAEELYIVFKVLGGAYLCFLAWRLWRGASNAAPEIAAAGPYSRLDVSRDTDHSAFRRRQLVRLRGDRDVFSRAASYLFTRTWQH